MLDDRLYKLGLVEVFLLDSLRQEGVLCVNSGLPVPDEAVTNVTGRRRRAKGGWQQRPLPRRDELAICIGAIIGVSARYLIGTVVQGTGASALPLGTLLINLVGCLLIGIVQTLGLELIAVRRELQLGMSVGVLGGFTTFSTFSLETVQLLAAGRDMQALAYQLLSLGGGLLAVVCGSMIARLVYRQVTQRRRHRT